jgi:hypothetical protein
MPGEVATAAPSRSDQPATASLPRHDRAAAMSFVTDATTETALRDGLADVLPEGLDTHRGGIGAAIAMLQKIASPQVLIVDITGEDQPLAALGNLSIANSPAAWASPNTCPSRSPATSSAGISRRWCAASGRRPSARPAGA